jgi:hypothetical protein
MDAAGSLRQALDGYLVMMSERPWRGVSIAYGTLALPNEPRAYLNQLPALLSRVAARDR